MSKNTFWIVLTVINSLALSTALGLYFIKPAPMVYVDSARLINGYTGMQDARKAYQQKAGAWKANIDTLTSDVQRQITNYEKESSKMTQKERQLSQELIRTKQNQLVQYQQAMNAQAQQEDAKMTGEVVSQVNTFLKKYGQEKGYTIIMAATEYGNIAYADEALDITNDVLERLNNEYSGR